MMAPMTDRVSSQGPLVLAGEADAYEFFERLRWGDSGPTECPHCGSRAGAWFLKPKDPGGRKAKGGSDKRSDRRVWKCRENTCRRQFSVLTGTVLHRTKVPLQAWIQLVFDLCNEHDGLSARQVAERYGVRIKSAQAMLQRIQEALWSPEAAGADLASNAPLWFEVPAANRAAKPRQAQAERTTKTTRVHDQRDLDERVQEDVQRALLEVETAPSDAPSRAPSGTRRDRRNPSPVAAAARPRQVARPTFDGPADQIRSDVERALAEAFAQPVQEPGSALPTPVENSAKSNSESNAKKERQRRNEADSDDAAASLGAGWLDEPPELPT